METFNEQRFTRDVVSLAIQMEVADALNGGRLAIAPVAENELSQPISKGDVEIAIAESRILLQQPAITERLCPALRSVSDDIRDVAKIVSAAMLPLALVPGSVIPLSPLVFAAVALVLVRAGVNSICPPARD